MPHGIMQHHSYAEALKESTARDKERKHAAHKEAHHKKHHSKGKMAIRVHHGVHGHSKHAHSKHHPKHHMADSEKEGHK